MENTYRDLAKTIIDAAATRQRGRFLVAVAGAPGSGKTTLTTNIVHLLNSDHVECVKVRQSASKTTQGSWLTVTKAAALCIDGFHLPRSVLDDMPNSQEAHARRGAPWTFDVKRIIDLVTELRNSADLDQLSRPPIYAPTFDHALKDPIDHGLLIPGQVSIVLLEGNYLLLDEKIWREISNLVDLRIFVQVDPMEARSRVAARHVHAGIEATLEAAEKRFDTNDALNGALIRERMISPDIRVTSVASTM